ncbi:TlpA disulfide reductase family protein [Flexithrix dorotheae]|uniref:TlpA disulfide reductase family protein n=1 Tax=Flexithrix dorotheae TaxID=70993 RepID=UPI00035C50AE|nr:TlpA disulfide reductase family protein [Flexithrix dorotheae]
MKILKLLVFTLFLYSASVAQAQEVEVISVEDLDGMLSNQEDKWQVINFWATWCAPCIKEMPYFEKANQEYQDKNVEFTFVSIDFPQLLEKKVKPFVAKKGLKTKVVLLDPEGDDSWISHLNKNWDGSIPITIIFNNAKKKSKFIPNGITYEELDAALKELM